MIISIVNQKGGTAKTTTTANLGCALAKLGKEVLLIDFDPQASLSYSFGYIEPDHNVTQVAREDTTFDESILEVEGLHLLPSDISLADLELSLVDSENREQLMDSILKPIKRSYDYILIDCPPSLSLLTINALTASDQVLVPMQLDVLSLQGLELILDTVERISDSLNPNLTLMGVLPVLVDFRRKLTQEVLDYLEANFDLRVFEQIIRMNVKASEAPSFGKSVVSYAPKSNSAKDYMAFAETVLTIVNN